jgi:hypothetical protein
MSAVTGHDVVLTACAYTYGAAVERPIGSLADERISRLRFPDAARDPRLASQAG